MISGPVGLRPVRGKANGRYGRLCGAAQVAALLVVYVAAVATRVGVCNYQARGHDWFPFTGESALLYYYASHVAHGESIPSVDRMVQAPEGMRVARSLSLGLEFFAGGLYRILPHGSIDFQRFMRLLTPIIFSIAVFPVYLCGRSLWKGGWGPLGSAACYAVSLPAVIRSTGQEVSAENFALPAVFFHVWLFMGGKGGLRRAIAGALFLVAAIVFWEGTQVYLYLLVFWFLVQWLRGKDAGRTGAFAIQMVVLTAAGAAVPYLRSHGFCFSYAMALAWAILAAACLERRFGAGRVRRVRLLLPFAVVALGIVLAFGRYHSTYSHMETLLFWKLRFLAHKPLDPSRLPFDVRVLWTPALVEPGLLQLLVFFGLWIVLAAVPLVCLLGRRFPAEEAALGSFVVVGSVSFLFLYLLFERLMVYLVFFLALPAGGLLSLSRRRAAAVVASLALGVATLLSGAGVYGLRSSIGRPEEAAPYEALGGLVARLGSKTPPDAVVLAPFDLSPVILAYGHRRIVQNPKFEDPSVRLSVREYAFALFSEDEEAFHAYCEKVSASYFVFPRGTFATESPYSWRYVTGTPASRVGSTAWKFERFPLKLRKFGLDYENERYKLYKVFRTRDIEAAESHRTLGDSYLEGGLPGSAVKEYLKALELYPKLAEAHARLGSAYAMLGEDDKAREEWARAYELLEVR